MQPISKNGKINLPLFEPGVPNLEIPLVKIPASEHKLTLPDEILNLGGRVFLSRTGLLTGNGMVIGAWINHYPSNNSLLMIPHTNLSLSLLRVVDDPYDTEPSLMMNLRAMLHDIVKPDANEIPVNESLTVSLV